MLKSLGEMNGYFDISSFWNSGYSQIQWMGEGWEFGCKSLRSVEYNFGTDLAIEILKTEITGDMHHLVIVI